MTGQLILVDQFSPIQCMRLILLRKLKPYQM